jgi:transposase-like protein
MKKHSRHEILLKLEQAAELARAGRSQVEVCQALDISVMTFHRWRKLPLMPDEPTGVEALGPQKELLSVEQRLLNAEQMTRLVAELTIENRRLRKIVTDLLLEKTRMEEAALQPILTPNRIMTNTV